MLDSPTKCSTIDDATSKTDGFATRRPVVTSPPSPPHSPISAPSSHSSHSSRRMCQSSTFLSSALDFDCAVASRGAADADNADADGRQGRRRRCTNKPEDTWTTAAASISFASIVCSLNRRRTGVAPARWAGAGTSSDMLEVGRWTTLCMYIICYVRCISLRRTHRNKYNRICTRNLNSHCLLPYNILSSSLGPSTATAAKPEDQRVSIAGGRGIAFIAVGSSKLQDTP